MALAERPVAERGRTAVLVRLTGGGWVPWEDVWASTVEPGLRSTLRRLDAHLVDDLVQDVALKLLVHDRDFDTLDRLHGWCAVVARNHLIDGIRRARRLGGALPELVEAERVDDRTMDRLELSRVLRAVARLSPADQRALFDEAQTPGDRGAQNRSGVRRHRARTRLRQVLGGLAAVLGFRRVGKALAPAAMVTLAVVFVLPFFGPGDDEAPGGSAEPGPAALGASSTVSTTAPAPDATPSGRTTSPTAARPSALPTTRSAAPAARPASGTTVTFPTARTAIGPVTAGVRPLPPGEEPRDADGRLAITCGTDPVFGTQCLYYPVKLGIPYSIDPADPLP